MVVFTGPDKALLDRSARILDGLAKATGWESIADSRKRKAAKAEFDRLTRDARDLRMLAARLKTHAKDLGPKLRALGIEAQDPPVPHA